MSVSVDLGSLGSVQAAVPLPPQQQQQRQPQNGKHKPAALPTAPGLRLQDVLGG